MAHPVWLSYLLAVVLMAVGAYCLGRLVAVVPLQRRSHYDANAAHVLMAAAMVGMLVPRWWVLPIGVWEAVFAAMALWFVARTVRVVVGGPASLLGGGGGAAARHHLMHGVMAGTMVYMYRLGTPAGVTGMSMSGRQAVLAHAPNGAEPAVTLLLLVVLVASVAWQLDAVSRFAPSPVTSPKVAEVALAMVGPGGAVGGSVSRPDVAAPVEPAARPWLAPRLEVGCHIAMCLAMAYMLVLTF